MTSIKSSRRIIALIAVFSMVITLFGLSYYQKTSAEEAEDITVTLDFNGGKYKYGEQTTVTFNTYEGVYYSPSNYDNLFVYPNDEHKKIVGWFRDKECTVGNEFEKDFLYEDTTLYAKWDDFAILKITGATFEVMPDSQEWSSFVRTGTTQDYSVTFYDYIGRKAFGGLYTEPEGQGTLLTDTLYVDSNSSTFKFTYTVENDKELYIKWVKPVNLVFDANGGSLADDMPSYQRRAPGIHWVGNWSDEYPEPIPTREGYTFIGWSPDQNATTGVALNDYIATKNETLYAVWAEGTTPDPAHTHIAETIPGWDATCTEVGATEGSKCSVCGEVLKPQVISRALGHNYVNGVCTRCGAKDPDAIVATPELISSEGKELNANTYTDLILKNAPGNEYEYKFIVHNSTTNQWFKLQDFSDVTTFRWYTGPAGVKNLYVDIRDKTDKTVIKRVELTNVVIKNQGLTVKSFTSSKGYELTAKSQTALTAVAENGKTPYEYKFIVHNDDNGQWYKIQDFSTKNTCDWYTGPAGHKTLYVDVRDTNGTVVRKGLNVTVN